MGTYETYDTGPCFNGTGAGSTGRLSVIIIILLTSQGPSHVIVDILRGSYYHLFAS